MAGPEPSSSNGGPGPMPQHGHRMSDAGFPDRSAQPTYPSLAYPAAGPSQPHYPPQGGWQQQQQHQQPQQQYNPHFYQPSMYPPHHPAGPRPQPNGGGFQPGGFRYDPAAYQAYPYPPQFYPPYGQMPVPGPGPGTMQNGYYMGGNFPRPYPFPDGGNEPKFPHAHDPSAGDESGAGFHSNPSMQFQHQPYYPPGHPYAYGGGIGYQQPMPFNGGGGFRPDGYPHDHHQHHHLPPIPPPSKALNPAAQGFHYPVRKAEPPLANGRPNGHHDAQSTAPPSVQEDGATEVVVPEPQKPGETGSLGLSLEPSEPSEPHEPEPVATVADEEEGAAAPVAADHAGRAEVPEEQNESRAVEVTTVVPEQDEPSTQSAAQVPEAREATPQPTDTPEPDVHTTLTFTGATLAGYTSPPPKASLPPKPDMSTIISLRPARPATDVDGNSYAVHLAALVPDAVETEQVAGDVRKRSTRGRPKPRGKAVFVTGARSSLPASPLLFGSIASPPATPAPTATAPLPATASPPSTASSAAAPTPPPPTRASAPAPAPAPAVRPKPSSWAAILRTGPKGKPTGTPDSLSVAPSSTLPSPSRSITSLPSDVGQSHTPQSDDPTTPRSAAPSLPPSTGPAPAQPRPMFNYAAAAAVGTALSPAEDLARLLTEGLRTRPMYAPAPVVPRGLINTGNMCFANTILQVLVYCTPFTELFDELGKRLKADFARRTPLLEAMIVFLREFAPSPSLSGISTPNGKNASEAFVPENVYDAMKENKRFDSMRRGFQEDAEEYLGFFLNTLHEELLGLYSRVQPPRSASRPAAANGDSARTIDRPVSPGAAGNGGDDWLEVGKKQRTHVVRTAESRESAVSRIFGGTLRSVLHAPGQKDSVTLEPYQPLQLDVQAHEVLTLVDALRHLNEPEIVPGVWSAARGANVDATKQVYLESFPRVLILHLKRFVYDPQEQNVVKRSKPVAYGTELVIPEAIISPPKRTAQNVKYRLFGVVYHHGYSATGGHYTVAVARPDGTGWLHFDDESVQPVPTEDVVVSDDEARSGRAGTIGGRERCAYLLFYQRVK